LQIILTILTNTPYIDVQTHQKSKPQNGCVSVINLFAGQAQIPDQESNTFFSIGVHPWHIDMETEASPSN